MTANEPIPHLRSVSEADVSLREYLTALIDGAEKRSDERFEAMKEMVAEAFRQSQLAIDKAEQATEKRFEGVNEFRAQLADQAARFVTRDTLDALVSKLEVEIDRNRADLNDLAKRVDLREGEAVGSRLTIGMFLTIGALGVGILGVVIVIANILAR